MNGSRSSSPRPGDRSSLDALSRTIEGLEARIEDLMTSPGSREPRRAPERERERPREREIEREDRRGGRAAGSSVQNALDEIRQRQRMLEAGQKPARTAEPHAERYEERTPPPRREREVRPEPTARDTMQDIAQALVNLRHELKQDISEGVSREIGGLLSEMRSIKSMAGDRRYAEDMRGDIARLADGIGQISRQAQPDEAATLRAEFEDLRAMMDNLAREDSVLRMESRWNGVEERLSSFNTEALQDELVSLAYRLDDIKSQLGTMSDVPAIRTLENRMMSIASTLDEIGKHIEPRNEVVVEQFAGLDRRLDEISRAIAASTRSSAPAVDPVFLQRLENRIGALAEQIEDIGAAASRRPDPAIALNARLESLAERIEDLAGERTAARLEERLDALSTLMESNQRPAQHQPELTRYLSDISKKIDALDHGLVNDVLAERLDLLARRIDGIDVSRPLAAPVFDDSAIRRLESQIGGIAARLDETVNAPASDNRALAGLEAQIANLSRLISQPQAATGPIELSPQLDSRMAAIEDYIATSDEYIIEAARQAAEAVLDGFLRNGGATATSAPAADIGALTALAEDLRHLEDLTRNSDERTHRTFEALHDTLLQIAGRLEDIEGASTPPADRHEPQPRREAAPAAAGPAFAFTGEPRREDSRTNQTSTVPVFNDEDEAFIPAPAIKNTAREVAALRNAEREFEAEAEEIAAPAGIRPPEMPRAQPEKAGFLGSLTKRFLAKSKESAAAFEAARTVVDPAPSIAPDDLSIASASDELLEPGTGTPDVKRILERVRASQGQTPEADDNGRIDYISAARRAAQAAARELGPDKGKGDRKTKSGSKSAKTASGESALARYRRPLLLAVGAVLLVVMSMPLVNTLLNGDSVPPVVDNPGRPVIEEQALEKKADVPAAPAAEAFQPDTEQAGIDARLDAETPSGIANTPASTIETLPLAPASSAGGSSATFAAQPPVAEAITVPADVQPASLNEAARNGDALALFEIGARYTEGRAGLTTDPAEAAVWYKLSADRGFAPAQYRLANLYEKGTGVAPDAVKAMDYYRKAAAQGNASAMHNLAVMYASGVSGAPDLAEAVTWFRQAADLGISDSQFNLAILYARGSGVSRNLEESYKWFAIAAKGGDKDAAQKRDEVANALKPEQLESARARTEVWKQLPLDSRANDAIIPDEWAGKGLKTASVDMKKAIRNIQAILNNNGYDAGAPDGEMGPKTVTAIKSFQKSVGQEPTGKITDALVKELLARNK